MNPNIQALKEQTARFQRRVLNQGMTESQLSSQIMPGIVGYEWVSLTSNAIQNPGEGLTTSFKNPQDTNKLVIIQFDSNLYNLLTLKVQSSRKLTLDGYSTKIGNVGVVYLDTPIQQTDVISFSSALAETLSAAQSVSFNFGFMYDSSLQRAGG